MSNSAHFRTQRVAAFVSIATIVVLFITVFLILRKYCDYNCAREAVYMLIKFTLTSWITFFVHVIAPSLFLSYLIIRHRARTVEKLILDENGITYFSPLPSFTKFVWPDWKLNWNTIDSAELSLAFRGLVYQTPQLTLTDPSGRKKIMPLRWVDPLKYEPISILEFQKRRWTQRKHRPTASEAMQSPLLEFSATHLPNITENFPKSTRSFSLNTNPLSKWLSITLLGILIYAGFDLVLLQYEDYAGQPFYFTYIAVALIGFGIASKLLYRQNIPHTERVGLSLLFAASIGFALYPGLLRINKLTDQHGLQNYKYQLTNDFKFEALKTDLPNLYMKKHKLLLSHLSPGDTQYFQLHRGGLGFWQINTKSMYDDAEKRLKETKTPD